MVSNTPHCIKAVNLKGLLVWEQCFLFRLSIMTNSLWPHGLQNARLFCPSSSTGVCSNSCPLSQWCHLTISSSVFPFSSCLQSFPVSGSFLMKILSTLYSWYVIIWHSKNSFFPPLMNMLFLLIYSCRSFVFLYRSFIVQLVKNPPVMQETPVQFLGWEDPLEKG